MSSITYRRNTQEDTLQIQKLFSNCFGDRSDNKWGYEISVGRYLCAFDGDRLVGFTGILSKSNYNGYEVDWSCVDIEYRGQGIMTELLSQELIRIGYDKDVYCSCWAVGVGSDINLRNAMDTLGFKLVVPKRITYDSRVQRFCKTGCVNYHYDCKCREDLYLRRGLT